MFIHGAYTQPAVSACEDFFCGSLSNKAIVYKVDHPCTEGRAL